MSDAHQDHHEDNEVNVKVALFLLAVVAEIIFLAMIN